MYRCIYALIAAALLVLTPRANAAIALSGTPTVSGYDTTTNSIAVVPPLASTTAAADTIIIITCQQDNSGSPGYNTPSTWTVVPNAAHSTGVVSVGAFYKIYTNGSAIPATVTVTTVDAGGGFWACMSEAFTGMSTSTPWDLGSGQTSTTSAAQIPMAAITTTVNSDQIIMAGMARNDVGASAVFSCTNSATIREQIPRSLTSADSYGAICDYNKATAGATGTNNISWTGGNSVQPNASWIAAMEPSSGAPAGQTGWIFAQ